MLPLDHAYSRASICFSMNIEISSLITGNMTLSERQLLLAHAVNDTGTLDNATKARAITTISDLETYAIVKERIIEARQLLDTIDANNPDARDLSYANERLMSADTWSAFFGMPGRRVQLDTAYLQNACLSKMSEAEERINYVRFYTPSLVSESEQLLSDARDESMYEPILCIFTASKAKAQANLLASAISVGKEQVDALILQKLNADEIVLKKQQEKGFFPIIGYSYTQYAADLRDPMPYSALTFSEYALELSNLDLYFPNEQPYHFPEQLWIASLLFLSGALFGIAFTFFASTPKR